MNPKGAPSKLTKALIDTLCGYVAKGTPLTVACKAAGIHRSTLYIRWTKMMTRCLRP